MTIVPITLKEARRFVDLTHRRHRAPQGGLFAIALEDMTDIIGVVIVGRPVSRHLDDTFTTEVTRLAVEEGHPNACSKLYSAAWRAARARGYRRMISYTLATEAGTSLRAAGWRVLYTTRAESWDRDPRPRVDTHPTEQKVLWEAPA